MMSAAAPSASAGTVARVGPLLHLRGVRDGRLRLAAVLVLPRSQEPPTLASDAGEVAAEAVLERPHHRVFRYSFSLPARDDAGYALGAERYPVSGAFAGDLRIAFVSCNGQEAGDRERPPAERNVMWRRLAREHAARPFQLLLHGGDQVYADEFLEVHPLTRAWAEGDRPGPPAEAALADLAEALREALFQRYLEIFAQAETAWLMARVPSLAMWDDHDICDGWGSLPVERLDSPVGRTVFEVAREHFLLFQLGCAPGETPEICPDRSGTSLSWHAALPGLHLIASDLRSERRPRQVMGAHGWRALDSAAAAVGRGRVLLLSSVPALGPRLSWVEAALRLTPRIHTYEDDLRDQWQSRAHRAEWRRFLEQLLALHRRSDTRVTLLSGEIHLATRGTMATPDGPMHQLVASGIAHPPPPKLYARTLSLLARLGESPLPRHPIRLHPLPGQPAIYTAQRNYLVLERDGERWGAWWELEADGATAPLDLG